jgi:hypothetical protein
VAALISCILDSLTDSLAVNLVLPEIVWDLVTAISPNRRPAVPHTGEYELPFYESLLFPIL